jgi:hypothetical protein
VRFPLELELSPLPAYRMPAADEERVFEFGYRLRLADGRLLEPGDPLLAALGAEVSTLIRGGTHEDALQAAWALPGTPLTLELEGHDEDGDAIVGVWDAGGARCAGHLALASSARAAALLELELDVRALALSEARTLGEDRRTALHALLYLPATLSVDVDARPPFTRPERSAPRRIVLCADASGEIRAWDPAADAGPAAIDALPVSSELKRELARLRDELPGEAGDADAMLEREFTRGLVEQRSLELWRRARRELGRRYAVGFLGPEMERPIWSPAELAGEEDLDLGGF